MSFDELSTEAKSALRRLYQGHVLRSPSKSLIQELLEAGYIGYHDYMVFSYGLTEKTRDLFNIWRQES